MPPVEYLRRLLPWLRRSLELLVYLRNPAIYADAGHAPLLVLIRHRPINLLNEFTKFLQASWSSPPTCCSMCAESYTLYTYATPGVKVRAVSFWSHPSHFSRYSFSFLRLPAFLSSASIEETPRSPSYIVHVWISCQWEELVRMQCFCACRTPISGLKM